MSGLNLRTHLDKPELDPDGDDAVCKVEIDFDVASARDRELPLHVVFCIDVSGSMKVDLEEVVSGSITDIFGDTPLDNAIRGGREALDKLRSDDYFSVVAFANKADSAIAPTRATPSGKRDGETAIDTIDQRTDTGGGTTIMQGVKESLKQFRQMPDEAAVRWIVFLTDGSDKNFVPERAGRKIDGRGITAHTAGFGGYDEETLRKLATETNGTWEHIANPGEMPAWFQKQISSARGVVATDPDLHIEPDGATLEGAFYTVGAGDDEEPRPIEITDGHSRVTADIGDLNVVDPPDVYLEFDVPPTPEDQSSLCLADLTLDTRAGRATATVEAKLFPPMLQADDSQNPSVRKAYDVGNGIMKALDDDLEAGVQEMREKGIVEESVADDIESSHEKEAKDKLSGLMQTAVDDEDD